MHNIAEGFDGGSNAEFAKFLRYSQRSASEVQSQLYVALDQNYISQAEFDEIYALAGHAHSKVGGFIAYLVKSGRK
jgi:four helix bundle protein